MITFKQFIAEIDFDDSFVTKAASTGAAQKVQITDDWESLPVKVKFKVPGFKSVYKQNGPRAYKLALLSELGEVAVVMDLTEHSVTTPAGKITGVATDGVVSDPKFRGKNLGFAMYASLVENGQVLFSSTYQTTGSRLIWEKLVHSVGVPFVVATGAEASWYIRRAKEYEYPDAHTVLLQGDRAKMLDEAYASRDIRLMILPTDFHDLQNQKRAAITL